MSSKSVLNKLNDFSMKSEKSLTLKNKNLNLNYLVMGLLVVYAALVAPLLPRNVAQVFKHTWVRVVCIIIIAAVCLVSPLNAMLLAIGFVVSLQRLHTLNGANTANTNNHAKNHTNKHGFKLGENNLGANNNVLMNALKVNNEPVPVTLNGNSAAANNNVELVKNVANSLNNNAQELKNLVGNSAPNNVVSALNNVVDEAQNVAILVNKEVNNAEVVNNVKNLVKNINELKNTVVSSNAPENVKSNVNNLANDAESLLVVIVAPNNAVANNAAPNNNNAAANNNLGAPNNAASPNNVANGLNNSLANNPLVVGENNLPGSNLKINDLRQAANNVGVDLEVVRTLCLDIVEVTKNLNNEVNNSVNNLNTNVPANINGMVKNLNNHANTLNNNVNTNVVDNTIVNSVNVLNKKASVLANTVNANANTLNNALVNEANNLEQKANNLKNTVVNAMNNVNISAGPTNGVSYNSNLNNLDGLAVNANSNLLGNNVLPDNVDKLENNNLNNVIGNLGGNNNVNNLVSNNVSNLSGNNVSGNNVSGCKVVSFNIDDLNDNMSVLSNSDNSLADIVNTNNRNSRKNFRSNDKNKLNSTNPYIKNTLLMNGVEGYTLENKNKLSGSYRNDVAAVNHNELLVRNPYRAPLSPAKKRPVNTNFNVGPNNSSNMIDTHPTLPPSSGPEIRFQPYNSNSEPSGFNCAATQYNSVNSPQFNVEGFQNKVANNVLSNNNGHTSSNNVVVNDVDASNHSGISNNNNSAGVPACKGLPYSTHEQLRKAQDRRVLCDGTPNQAPHVAYSGIQSAQGYGESSPVSGFNESGHNSINYLCLGNK